MDKTKGKEFFKQKLNPTSTVTLEEAIFRSEQAFKPANIREHAQFWEEEILKEYPQKTTLLSWIEGVKIEEFLNSLTDSEFQGVRIYSHYPQPQAFQNYVPQEFEKFIDDTVLEWESSGVLQEWSQVRFPDEPLIPTVVSPLGVEPTKPRALWDGRFVNEFCRDISFTMDNRGGEIRTKGANMRPNRPAVARKVVVIARKMRPQTPPSPEKEAKQ